MNCPSPISHPGTARPDGCTARTDVTPVAHTPGVRPTAWRSAAPGGVLSRNRVHAAGTKSRTVEGNPLSTALAEDTSWKSRKSQDCLVQLSSKKPPVLLQKSANFIRGPLLLRAQPEPLPRFERTTRMPGQDIGDQRLFTKRQAPYRRAEIELRILGNEPPHQYTELMPKEFAGQHGNSQIQWGRGCRPSQGIRNLPPLPRLVQPLPPLKPIHLPSFSLRPGRPGRWRSPGRWGSSWGCRRTACRSGTPVAPPHPWPGFSGV